MLRKHLIILLALLSVTFTACNKSEEPKEPVTQNTTPGVRKAEIKEVIQVSTYTYLRVNENGKELWLAASKMQDAKAGQPVYFGKSMEMKNFNSPELNRTFESVLFVQEISLTPPSTPPGNVMNEPVKPTIQKVNVRIEPISGGVTLAQLFENPAKYSGKSIKVTGQVTKLNPGIMDHNWLHVQDGTESNGKFDLTITTKDAINIGDIVIAEGKISLNKDFGYGYKYDVIMEEATVVKK